MAHDGTSSSLFSYFNVFMEAIAERSSEETALVEKSTAATVAAVSHANDDTLFGSFIVSLLFVPFSIYCGVVVFVVGFECYQFFAVWNLVSRTRTQNGVSLDMAFGSRHQVSDQTQSREKQSQLQEKLFVREYRGTGDSSFNDECTKQCCTICLSELHVSDKVASIRDCSCCKTSKKDEPSTNHHRTPHLFHVDCLTQWLEESPSCPYCRDQLLPPLATEKTNGRGTLQLSETLELATLEVEHYLFNALTIFGGMVASFTSFSNS